MIRRIANWLKRFDRFELARDDRPKQWVRFLAIFGPVADPITLRREIAAMWKDEGRRLGLEYEIVIGRPDPMSVRRTPEDGERVHNVGVHGVSAVCYTADELERMRAAIIALTDRVTARFNTSMMRVVEIEEAE